MKNKDIVVVQNLIRCLNLEDLKNPEVVANLISAFGHARCCPGCEADGKFKIGQEDIARIYQIPDQMAKALVYLAKFEINSYLEIGIFQGGNFLFVSEYLRRFNPGIQCLGIDPTDYLNDEIRVMIEAEPFLSFRSITSNQVAGRKFDLVFIDGEHTTAWITKDFENIGRHAKICMFHDIQELSCPDAIAFWENIKDEKSVEFIESSVLASQGIGIK